MLMKVKWTPVLVLMLAGAGTASKTVMGTSALIVRNQNFGLGSHIDLDLGRLENSISRLESQVDFLIEVVLQN